MERSFVGPSKPLDEVTRRADIRRIVFREALAAFRATGVLIWAGLGRGQPCHVCGYRSRGLEFEYEVELPWRDGIRLCAECRRLWEQEAQRSCGARTT